MSNLKDFGRICVDGDWDDEVEIMFCKDNISGYMFSEYLNADQALELGNLLIELANKIKERNSK